MTHCCAICRRCRGDRSADKPSKSLGGDVQLITPLPCVYGGPFSGWQRVAADGLTWIGPVERLP